ncbi:MAG: MFS transporter [Burkholderiales bacterium]
MNSPRSSGAVTAGFIAPLVVTLAIQIQASLVVFTPPVLAPAAAGDIGARASAVGMLTALIYATSVLSALWSGQVIDRVGAIRFSQLCLLCCSAGMAIMTFPHPAIVALGAIVVGVGYGAVTPASSSVLADRVPPGMRSFIFSLKQTGVPIGGAIAGAMVPPLIAVFGWQVAALVVAALGLLVIASAQTVQRKLDVAAPFRRAAPGAGLLEPLRMVFKHQRLRELAISSFAYSGMQMCLGSYLVVALIDMSGFSLAQAGAALSVAMIAGALARLFCGAIADHWLSSRRLLGILGVTMALSAFVIASISPRWSGLLVYVAALCYGATAVGWNGVYLAEVARIAPPGRAGAATGASLAVTYLGVVVLPLVFWAVHAASGGYAASFVVAGSLTLWRGLLFLKRIRA